ncbi:hypothetical protein [Pseudomonas sp. GM16]|uniref:hypothetical protein n=1 Tax=Pseudomonas sp. GM16 TaxID=1144322 RepID=UPI0002F30057
MAEETKAKASVLLTGIDELSPKLGALRVKVESFKNNLEQAGLGKLDISGLFKGGSVITPFVDGIKSAAAFQGKLTEVSDTAKTRRLARHTESRCAKHERVQCVDGKGFRSRGRGTGAGGGGVGGRAGTDADPGRQSAR